VIALFIDGPLAGEVKTMPPYSVHAQVYFVPLPARQTECLCDPGEAIVTEEPAGVFRYHLVAKGPKVLIYTESENDEDIVHSLKDWVISNFSAPRWVVGCRDRRAFR